MRCLCVSSPQVEIADFPQGTMWSWKRVLAWSFVISVITAGVALAIGCGITQSKKALLGIGCSFFGATFILTLYILKSKNRVPLEAPLHYQASFVALHTPVRGSFSFVLPKSRQE
jgi:hypothetical protein